jgi:hypothetical protein
MMSIPSITVPDPPLLLLQSFLDFEGVFGFAFVELGVELGSLPLESCPSPSPILEFKIFFKCTRGFHYDTSIMYSDHIQVLHYSFLSLLPSFPHPQ